MVTIADGLGRNGNYNQEIRDREARVGKQREFSSDGGTYDLDFMWPATHM